jgi:hypothetical protein
VVVAGQQHNVAGHQTPLPPPPPPPHVFPEQPLLVAITTWLVWIAINNRDAVIFKLPTKYIQTAP